jgi:phosphoribosyl-AMP cyclohydrolase
MRKLSYLFFAALIFTGCTSTGAFLSANQTIVNLNEGNYTIAVTNVTGESESAYVFGLSYSTGLAASTFAIARVEGTGMLYSEALENLWANFEATNGTVRDQKLALVNVRYDTDTLNLFVYTKVRVIVRADVVEFD